MTGSFATWLDRCQFFVKSRFHFIEDSVDDVIGDDVIGDDVICQTATGCKREEEKEKIMLHFHLKITVLLNFNRTTSFVTTRGKI